MVILDRWGTTYAKVLFCLSKELLFKYVWGHCAYDCSGRLASPEVFLICFLSIHALVYHIIDIDSEREGEDVQKSCQFYLGTYMN